MQKFQHLQQKSQIINMQILATNNKFVLASNKAQTFLVSSQDFKIVATKETYSKFGSLQYGTSIAALTSGSVALIYDFKYQRELYSLETYKKIFSICIKKNILIIISQDRILLHNLQSKTNECFLDTSNGTIAFVNDDYYKLSIFYQQSHYTLRNRSIWAKKQQKIQEGIKYQLGCYFCFNKTNLFVLSLENVLSIYEQHDLVKVYGYDAKIIGLCSNQDFVFVVLTSGDVIGQNLRTQFSYEFQKVQDCQLEAIAIQPLQTKIFIVGNFLYLWFEGQLKRANFAQKIQILSKQQQAKNEKLRLEQIQQQKLAAQQILEKEKQQNQKRQIQLLNQELQKLQKQQDKNQLENQSGFVNIDKQYPKNQQFVGKLYREYDVQKQPQRRIQQEQGNSNCN